MLLGKRSPRLHFCLHLIQRRAVTKGVDGADNCLHAVHKDELFSIGLVT